MEELERLKKEYSEKINNFELTPSSKESKRYSDKIEELERLKQWKIGNLK